MEHRTYSDHVLLGYMEELGLGKIVKSVSVSQLGEAYMVTLRCTEKFPAELRHRLFEQIRFRMTHRKVYLNGMHFEQYCQVNKLAVRYFHIKEGHYDQQGEV